MRTVVRSCDRRQNLAWRWSQVGVIEDVGSECLRADGWLACSLPSFSLSLSAGQDSVLQGALRSRYQWISAPSGSDKLALDNFWRQAWAPAR